MDFILNHLLTFILFLPAASAIVLPAFCQQNRSKLSAGLSLILSLLPLVLTLVAWFRFNPVPDAANPFRFEELCA